MSKKQTIYRIGLLVFAAFFIYVCLVAFVIPIRTWHDINVNPLVMATFGGIITLVVTSPLWLTYIAPTLNAWIIGLIIGIFPVSFPFIHRSFNWYRAKHVKSADKESGHMYPVDLNPISSHSEPAKPQPTSKSEQERTTTPKTESVTPPPQQEKPSGGES